MIDDELHDRLVKPLPPGCRLTAIFDSCHSGSAMDLPYTYSTSGQIKEQNGLQVSLFLKAGSILIFKFKKGAGSGLLSAGMNYVRGDSISAIKGK